MKGADTVDKEDLRSTERLFPGLMQAGRREFGAMIARSLSSRITPRN